MVKWGFETPFLRRQSARVCLQHGRLDAAGQSRQFVVAFIYHSEPENGAACPWEETCAPARVSGKEGVFAATPGASGGESPVTNSESCSPRNFKVKCNCPGGTETIREEPAVSPQPIANGFPEFLTQPNSREKSLIFPERALWALALSPSVFFPVHIFSLSAVVSRLVTTIRSNQPAFPRGCKRGSGRLAERWNAAPAPGFFAAG